MSQRYEVYAYEHNIGRLLLETETLLEARRNAIWYAKRYNVETEVVRKSDRNVINRYNH